jgi:hypothetical protein
VFVTSMVFSHSHGHPLLLRITAGPSKPSAVIWVIRTLGRRIIMDFVVLNPQKGSVTTSIIPNNLSLSPCWSWRVCILDYYLASTLRPKAVINNIIVTKKTRPTPPPRPISVPRSRRNSKQVGGLVSCAALRPILFANRRPQRQRSTPSTPQKSAFQHYLGRTARCRHAKVF